jgi:hypothetical protein
MAPYALTPTVERGELPDGGWATSPQVATRNGGSSAMSTSPNTSHRNDGDNDHTHIPYELDSPTNDSVNGANTPKSTNSYEDAYVQVRFQHVNI